MSKPSKEQRRTLYLAYGQHFRQQTGRAPARLDFRGANLEHYRQAHGVPYPSAKQVEAVFGSWGAYATAVGGPSISPKVEVGYRAVEFMRRQFGLVVEDGHMGAVDGVIDGRTVEVKGATLSKDRTFGHVRWRFRLHHRRYSLLVDELWLVGLHEQEAVIAWRLNKSDMVRYADDRDAISIGASAALKGHWYPLAPNEAWRKELTRQQVHDIISLGATELRYRPSSERS